MASGESTPWNSKFSDSDFSILPIQSNQLDSSCWKIWGIIKVGVEENRNWQPNSEKQVQVPTELMTPQLEARCGYAVSLEN